MEIHMRFLCDTENKIKQVEFADGSFFKATSYEISVHERHNFHFWNLKEDMLYSENILEKGRLYVKKA